VSARMNGRMRDRGSVSIAMIFITFIALVGCGLVLNLGETLAVQRRAAVLADSAARAGASVPLSAGTRGIPEDSARAAAERLLEQAGVDRTDRSVSFRNGRIYVTVTMRYSPVVFGGATRKVVRDGWAELVVNPQP
jgi:Putative Flp pilus-assembly TadE/G-like